MAGSVLCSYRSPAVPVPFRSRSEPQEAPQGQRPSSVPAHPCPTPLKTARQPAAAQPPSGQGSRLGLFSLVGPVGGLVRRIHKPCGGMFVWIDTGLEVERSGDLLDLITPHGVVAIPGGMFELRLEESASACLRVSCCSASDEEMEEGMARLAVALREERGRSGGGDGSVWLHV